MEGEIGAGDAVSRQPVAFGLADGRHQPFDSQGVFVAHVKVAAARPDGHAGDEHPFQNAVGVAL